MLIKVRRIVQRCPPATTGGRQQARQQRRRSPRTRRWWLPVACTVVLVAISAYPRATNHQVRIEEAMAGANGDSQIQFVEMRMLASIQNCWGPQVDDAITPGADTSDDDCFFGGANETRSRAMLVFSDAIGREVGRFKFPENPPSGSQRVLIATQAFADLAGAPTPDFIMPPLMNPVNGKVCFKGNGTENANAFFISLCLSYGNFTGSTEGAGAAAAALSVVNTVSLERQPGTFSNLNSQFSIQNTPTPTNFNGDTFTIPIAPEATQGGALFNQETFGGNGRTCASCHVVSLNGGLNPANITTRFGTVSTTFDPLFVGETAATGFDFNLNTLTLTANSQHQSGTDFGNVSGGDLQGVITSAGLPKGRVLGRANGSYLIHGGFSPAVAGVVTDENGNEGTVNTVVQGGLNALETPSRMRTSASASFPQGRGLILENIDGFANPPVFRKSPHLLNLSRTAPSGLSGEFADTQVFTTGAVMQHFPRTLARLSTGGNPDFRLPTAAELAAMEAFMLAGDFPPGNDPNKFDLDRFALTAQQQSGQAAFFGAAKCSQCHGGDVLALTTVDILGKGIGVNAAFDTGVVNEPINGAGIDNLPCEPSVGMCGTREFSTPQLFNVKNLAPFFHEALVHEPESSDNRPDPSTSRPDRERGRPTEHGHAIQDVAHDCRFGFLGHRMSSAKPVANDRLVPEEGVLHPGLPVVARLLLPLAAPDLLDSQNGAIANARPGSPPRHRGGLRRWHHDRRATRTRGLVDRDRVLAARGRRADS